MEPVTRSWKNLKSRNCAPVKDSRFSIRSVLTLESHNPKCKLQNKAYLWGISTVTHIYFWKDIYFPKQFCKEIQYHLLMVQKYYVETELLFFSQSRPMLTKKVVYSFLVAYLLWMHGLVFWHFDHMWHSSTLEDVDLTLELQLHCSNAF
jgi:hypothetical protein